MITSQYQAHLRWLRMSWLMNTFNRLRDPTAECGPDNCNLWPLRPFSKKVRLGSTTLRLKKPSSVIPKIFFAVQAHQLHFKCLCRNITRRSARPIFAQTRGSHLLKPLPSQTSTLDLPGAPIMVAASDDLQKINSSVASSRLSTCQTPSEFHLFPKLPLELRRKIFEEVLPNQTGQILFLDWSFESVTMKSGNNLVFHLYPDYPRGHVEDLRVPLLSACSDSRKAYLKYNRDVLPARSGSVIRYSADGTTVCISAFDKIGTESYNAPWESSKTAYRQMWFRDIKHLATGVSALYHHFREQSSDLEGFSNLESWAGVIDSTTSTVAATRYRILLMERAQAQMEAYKKANPGYKGPRIFLSYLS